MTVAPGRADEQGQTSAWSAVMAVMGWEPSPISRPPPDPGVSCRPVSGQSQTGLRTAVGVTLGW